MDQFIDKVVNHINKHKMVYLIGAIITGAILLIGLGSILFAHSPGSSSSDYALSNSD